MVEIFFRLFNKALANFLGGEGYKFNLMMLCMDEVGANLQGVRNVFGDAFMSQVVSCQWHFMECAQRQLPYIDVNDKTTFMHYIRMICKHMPSINFIRMDWSTSAGKISDYVGTIGGRRGDTIWCQLCVVLDGWGATGLRLAIR